LGAIALHFFLFALFFLHFWEFIYLSDQLVGFISLEE
jgi:hypothetical protein